MPPVARFYVNIFSFLVFHCRAHTMEPRTLGNEYFIRLLPSEHTLKIFKRGKNKLPEFPTPDTLDWFRAARATFPCMRARKQTAHEDTKEVTNPHHNHTHV